MGRFGIWLGSWLGVDKLAQNLTYNEKVKVSTNQKLQGNEEETEGLTYDSIIEKLRTKAITNESISMVANAYSKGVYGAEVSVQNNSKDENINDEYEKLIKLFSRPENFTLEERFHFNFWARFAPEIYIRDGGFIVRKHKISPSVAKQRGYALPYRIEFIELSQINFDKNDKTQNIYNGIQLNAQGKPVKVFFKGNKEVSYKELIVFSKITRISQLNGVSPIYQSIESINRQDSHATAEVKNATEQAKVSDVYKTKIANVHKTVAQGDFELDLANANKIPTREVSPKMPEKEAKIIDVDEEYTRLSRGSYTSAFEQLTKYTDVRVAAGSSITVDEYTNNLAELTFHGGKEATIRNQETYKALRNDMDNLLWKPIFEDMIKWCYVTGYIDIEPTSDNVQITLIKKPRESNQPSQEAIAYAKHLEMGSLTLGDVVKKTTGENLTDFLKRRETEENMKLDMEIRLAEKKLKLEKLTQQGVINEG